MFWYGGTHRSAVILLGKKFWECQSCNFDHDDHYASIVLFGNDIVNIGLHFFLKNVRPYAASCSEA